MITDKTIINEIRLSRPLRPRPIMVAAECYRRWMGNVQFIDDLDYYQLNGVVVSSPALFLMAKVIEDPAHPSELAWFIRMFVGSIENLLPALPAYPITRMCFCRRGDGRVRSWPIQRMLHLEKLRLQEKLKRSD